MTDEIPRVVGCRSDFELGTLVGDIQIDGYKGLTSLNAEALRAGSENADAKAQRFELITSVNGGKHVELSVTAMTFRQRKAPNRRYLRLASDKLSERAPTWKNQPYLTDHNTYSMASAKGVILSSKAVEESANVTAFEQVLHVVKPDAVVGFLSGTYRKFSVGWFPIGPVLCSVHGCDIRGLDSCNCWPGDQVLVDGKPQIAEYVFSDFEGKETSTVVIPAVKDTSVSDIRAALTAELNLSPRRPRNKENRMRFHRLAAVLGLAALEDADENAAVLAVEALSRRATTAETQLAASRTELSMVRSQLTNAESALTTATSAARKIQVDTILGRDGYGAGKLRHGRDSVTGEQLPSPIEKRLRRIAGEADGIAQLQAELAEMPMIVPVAQRPASEKAAAPARTEFLDESQGLTVDNPYLANAAAQLGLKPEDMVAFAKAHIAGGE